MASNPALSRLFHEVEEGSCNRMWHRSIPAPGLTLDTGADAPSAQRRGAALEQ